MNGFALHYIYICAITLVLCLLPAFSFLSGNTILSVAAITAFTLQVFDEILHLQAQKEMQVCVTGRSEQRTEFNLIV